MASKLVAVSSTLEQIRDYLEVGIDRIIIGSMAVNPDFVRAARVNLKHKIVVGIDAKAGFGRYRRLVGNKQCGLHHLC